MTQHVLEMQTYYQREKTLIQETGFRLGSGVLQSFMCSQQVLVIKSFTATLEFYNISKGRYVNE